MRRRSILERDGGPATLPVDDFWRASENHGSGVELKWERVNDNRVQPDDVFCLFDFGCVVVLVDYVTVRFEMSVDDGMRVGSAGLVRMQRRKAGSGDQKRHRQQRHRRSGSSPKHSGIMSAPL